MKQRTLKDSIRATGIGLHSGVKVYMTLRPAPPNSGIIFRRIDLDAPVDIPANATRVTQTTLGTTIQQDQVKVATVEHLLSAMAGLGIDNAFVDVTAPEVPIMDGSAKVFVDYIEESGIINQKKDRKSIMVLKEVLVEENDSYVKIRPNNQFSINIEIDFPSKIINHQSCKSVSYTHLTLPTNREV